MISYNSTYQPISDAAPTQSRPCNKLCKYLLKTADVIMSAILMIVVVIVAIVAAYVVGIVIGVLYVGFVELFKIIVIEIFGKDAYYKNFAVCYDTEYIGANCYKTTSTYCTNM